MRGISDLELLLTPKITKLRQDRKRVSELGSPVSSILIPGNNSKAPGMSRCERYRLSPFKEACGRRKQKEELAMKSWIS